MDLFADNTPITALAVPSVVCCLASAASIGCWGVAISPTSQIRDAFGSFADNAPIAALAVPFIVSCFASVASIDQWVVGIPAAF